MQNSPILKSIIRKREIFYGERMIWIINGIKFRHNFTIDNKNFDPGNSHLEKIAKSLIETLSGKKKSKNKEKYFYWKWCRKSWESVQRNVFIDFGEESLFWVKVGMGTENGKGIYVSKVDFLNKYSYVNIHYS